MSDWKVIAKSDKSPLSLNGGPFDVLVTTILVIFMFQPRLRDCVGLREKKN